VSVTANVIGGNITTAGVITATGNITGGNISATTHTGTTVSVTGNVTAGNIINTGISSVTGNIIGGNISTAGQVSATGNITTSNSFVGNLVGTTASMTGNVYAGNIIVNGQPTTYGVANPAYAFVYLNTSTSYTNSAFDMVFDTIGTSNGITYSTSTGLFSLIAGVTYELQTNLYVQFEGSINYISNYQWVDSSNNALSPTQGQAIPVTSGYNDSGVASQSIIYTPSQNINVKVRWVGVYGGRMLVQGIKTWAKVIQLNPTIAVALSTINGNLTVGGNLTTTGGIRKSARVLTTTTTLTVADAGGFIEFSPGASAYTVTLPDPTQAANSGIGYRFWQNTSQNITLSTPAGNFYGPSGSSASTKVLAQATTQLWEVWSDGYNWAVFGIKTV